MSTKKDLDNILGMSYDEYVETLLKKYGMVPGDYFIDDESFRNNKSIVRSNDGLVIHHIDEDKICNLSELKNTKKAKTYFKYQKAERLVYCNLVEHMILHLKIMEKELSKTRDEWNKSEDVGIGGFDAINRKTNSILLYAYYHKVPKQIHDWDKISAQILKGWWTTVFLNAIQYFVEIVEKRPEFIERYGSEIELKKRLKTTHQIYKSRGRLFNQAIKISQKNNYIKKEQAKPKASLSDDGESIKVFIKDLDTSELIKSVIENALYDPTNTDKTRKNPLLDIDVTRKIDRG